VSILVLVGSITFQVLAAIAAFRLIKTTDRSYPWALISAALLLMTVRRLVPLYSLTTTPGYAVDLANETIGLILSVFMFVGVTLIRPMFEDRRRLEEKARESATRLQAVIDEAPVCIATVGLDKRFLTCNEAFCAFLGYSEEELKQKTIVEVTLPVDAAIGMADLRSIVAGEKTSSRVEKRYVRKDGTVVWGAVSINLVRNGQGQPLHFMPFILDMTERKMADEALRVEKANLYAVFESSPVAMFVVDETTNIVMTNRAFTVMCGGSESEILQHRPGNALRCVHSHKDPRGCGYSKECKSCNVRNGVEGLIANGGSLHGAELELELTRDEVPGRF
jgi:PAS domain S-box-containing protein